MQDQHRGHLQAVQDQHDEQLETIEENRRLSPTKFNQVQEDLRRGELVNHKKKVKALEKKNSDQETKHVRMIMMLDRVVDSQDNQLRHQKFEMGELEKKFQQEMKELKELKEEEMKELKEMEVKEVNELKLEVKVVKEMMEVGVETAERLKVEHDAKVHKLDLEVHKLEEDNKVLKSQMEHLKVDCERRNTR